MKYNKISIFVAMALTFFMLETRGQSTQDEIVVEPDSVVGKKVNLAFKKVDKADVNGAVMVLDPSEFFPYDNVYSVSDGVVGRVAGISGLSSVWGLGGAVIIIDGVPRRAGDVIMNEVEQITVLKGAAATVLYGAQAAKGAILVTTKRGKIGDNTINVNVKQGFAEAKAYPEYLSSADYMTLYNEARVNDGRDVTYSEETINNYRSGNRIAYPNVDYYSKDYLRRFSNNISAMADFTGGNEDAQFYANMGWHSSNTLLNVGEGSNDGSSRFNVRGNVDMRVNDFISSSIDATFLLYNSRVANGNYWYNASTIYPHKFTPLIPISEIDPNDAATLAMAKSSKNLIDGKYLLGGNQEYMTNPFADLYAGGYNRLISRIFQFTNTINFNLSNVIDGLSASTRVNVDYLNSYNQYLSNDYSVYQPNWGSNLGTTVLTGLTKYGNDASSGTQNISDSYQKRNMGFTVQFNYEKSVNDVHNFSAMVLGAAYNATTTDSIFQPVTYSNMGMQLAYNYDHKYWLEFSSAVVNSTKLPEDTRVGFAPTFTAAWLLSKENFLSDISAIDYLKLSATGGVSLTDVDINDYFLYDGIYEAGSYFTWNDGVGQNRASTSQNGANNKLSYVKRKEINVGLEGAFLNQMLYANINYFRTRMDGLVGQNTNQYPSYYSDYVPYENYGVNEYRGLDMAVNLRKNVGGIDLNLGVTATYVNTEVIKRDELYLDSYQNRTGKPVDAIFGLQSAGFFTSDEEIKAHASQSFGTVRPGDIKYIDQNKDGVIDSKDEVEIGRWSSPFYYGVNLTASYKNFTLYVLGTGSAGGESIKSNNYYMIDGNDKYSVEANDRWTEATKNSAKYPRLSSDVNYNNCRYSDFWKYSTNNFSVSKVQLTYTMPKDLISKILMKDMTVFVSGYNLLTVAENKDIMEMNIGSSPQCRYYNIGLTAKF